MEFKMIWDHRVFDLTEKSTDTYICLIILNQSIKEELFKKLYCLSSYKIYADGGGSLTRQMLGEKIHLYKPDIVLGDMDSLSKADSDIYAEMGVKKLVAEDQDNTDCDKSIMYFHSEVLPSLPKEVKNVKIVVVGAFGGRMDHTLQNVNLLWKYMILNPKPTEKHYELIMIDNHNMMCVLPVGENVLYPSKTLEATKGVGIIPIPVCDNIETSGLLYNMGRSSPFHSLKFGEFLSSSNEIISSEVKIAVSHPVLFMSTIQPF